MKLSDGEKLILVMLCDIYKALGIKRGEVDPQVVMDAIFGGHLWGLKEAHSGIFSTRETSEETVSEVIDILDMWAFLERDYENLSKEEKAQVKKEASESQVQFPGFDGNGEVEYIGVARFFTERLDRFTSFKWRDLNAHRTTLEEHRRMLGVFSRIRKKAAEEHRRLTAGEIIEVLNTRTPAQQAAASTASEDTGWKN